MTLPQDIDIDIGREEEAFWQFSLEEVMNEIQHGPSGGRSDPWLQLVVNLLRLANRYYHVGYVEDGELMAELATQVATGD